MDGYDDLSDTDLVKMLKAGSADAFTTIYERYWEKLLATAYFFTKQSQSAEDIVHDVMMSLWLRRGTTEIDNLQGYLATAVKFGVFKSIAKEKRRKDLLAGQMVTLTEEDIEQKLEAKFDEAYLHGIIEALPEKARLVFEFSRKEQLSTKEISNKLNISQKTAEYHLTKALKILREALRKIKILFV